MNTAMLHDRRYQAFLDWARLSDMAVLLDTAAQLMRGQYDPAHTQGRVVDLFFDLQHTIGWSGVFQVIAQVQGERETDGDE